MLEDLLERIDNPKDKNDILKTMLQVIEVSKKAQEDYTSLVQLIENIEVSPLWVINSAGEIFAQNKSSLAINELLQLIDLGKEQSEIEYQNLFYLIKIKHYDNKVIITATDITQSKLEDRLIAMGKMAGHLAHEIRNPIGSISLLTSTLASTLTGENQEMVLNMQKAIYRVERIIKATLEFGKKEPKIVYDAIALEDIELGIRESIQYYSFDKDIDFVFDFPQIDKINLGFEPMLIVFQNMVFNAIDAIEEQEQELARNAVEISYNANEQYHIFSFYDTGAMIENKEFLFEPYKSTKMHGHGLGLVLSQKIVKAHGGNILLDDTRKEFHIFLKRI